MNALNDALVQRMYDRQFFGIAPGLETTQALLAKVGNPEKALAAIHVAGTNGKGSVCALVAAGLASSGMPVGLYTSPHLVKLNERFQINGAMIPDDELNALLAEMEAVATDVERKTGRRATFFECTTVGCFLWFKRKGVKLCVVEVGLGGRLDATNVLTPLVSVITRISLDHQEYLGDTMEAIAAEKAGIIKEGRPVVVGEGRTTSPCLPVILRKARELHAPVILAAESVGVQRVSGTLSQQKVKISSQSQEYGTLPTPLAASYQIENIATAVAVLETLQNVAGIPLPDNAVKAALANVRWQGRFQLIAENPPTLLDGAHNPDGAEALVRALKDAVGKKKPMFCFVCGMCADKDVEGFFRILSPMMEKAWTVPVGSPRTMPPEKTAEIARRFSVDADVRRDVAEAIKDAQAWAKEQGAVVVICGSLFLAGEVLGLIAAS